MAATLTRDDELLFFSFPIDKSRTEETDYVNPVDGTPDLIVWGKATDGSLDADLQVVDPSWSAKAIREWFNTGANVRVQHQAQRDPAGKGIHVESTPDGTWVRTRVSEPVAKHLVRTETLNDYSVGISRPDIIRGPHPTLDPDGKAVNGIITGRKDGLSRICEISLVDRGSNFNSKFQVVKAAADGTCEWVGKTMGGDDVLTKDDPVNVDLPKSASITFSPADLNKLLEHRRIAQERETALAEALKAADTAERKILGKKSRSFSASRRRDLASRGQALDDGSYPIPDADALRRAAILARSGHGDVEAARRLIARRAKELGVANPLDEDDAVKKDEGAPVTAKADGDDSGSEDEPGGPLRHQDGGDDDTDTDADAMDKAAAPQAPPAPASPALAKRMKCPNCGKKCKPNCKFCPGCGKPMMTGKADKPTPDGGAAGAAEHAIQPAPEHREPDGPAIEALEHDAHLPTVPDAQVKAAAALRALGVPWEQGWLHDTLCPAYSREAVKAAWPMADLSMIDSEAWGAKALEIASSAVTFAQLQKAQNASVLWESARTLKTVTPDLADDLMSEANKAFRDANPGPGKAPVPGEISAQRFNRPLITAGHAAPSPGQDPPHTSPIHPGHIAASDFRRDLITSGHAADSPDNASPRPAPVPAPEVPGVPSRVFYTNTQRTNARQAMQAMHDHISMTFPDLCPMYGPGHGGQPPSHARPVPVGVGGPVPHGAGKSAPPLVEAPQPNALAAKAAKKERRRLEKAALAGDVAAWEALGLTAPAFAAKTAGYDGAIGQLVSPGAIEEIVTKAQAPLLAELTTLRQQVDAIADQPDPNVAAFRGVALTKTTAAPAGPLSVPTRAEHARDITYRAMYDQWRNSPDPGLREQALTYLMGASGIIPQPPA